MAKRLNGRELDVANLNQWLYIFTKGYVNVTKLTSKRAQDNWTAKSVADYMRCIVIKTHNEESRRDAFRTWIIAKKLADEKDTDKKNLFVVRYNPLSQSITFVKNICIHVDTRAETLGLLEHINLGTVQVIRTTRLLGNLKLKLIIYPGD